LIESSESEQPTCPVDLRDDGVDINLPSREEIEKVLKYLKNNKAAGTHSIAAELLKNRGCITCSDPSRPGLARHYREAGARRYCVHCTRRAIYSIVKTKSSPKILYDRLLPHGNAAVQHYQARFQSGKSTTYQLFALRQILEKCNEFNITTHHLFIDFKAAYYP
jgi:hypothetical protein